MCIAAAHLVRAAAAVAEAVVLVRGVAEAVAVAVVLGTLAVGAAEAPREAAHRAVVGRQEVGQASQEVVGLQEGEARLEAGAPGAAALQAGRHVLVRDPHASMQPVWMCLVPHHAAHLRCR